MAKGNKEKHPEKEKPEVPSTPNVSSNDALPQQLNQTPQSASSSNNSTPQRSSTNGPASSGPTPSKVRRMQGIDPPNLTSSAALQFTNPAAVVPASNNMLASMIANQQPVPTNYPMAIFGAPQLPQALYNLNSNANGLNLPRLLFVNNQPHYAIAMNNPIAPQTVVTAGQLQNWINEANMVNALQQLQNPTNVAISNNFSAQSMSTPNNIAAALILQQAAQASNLGANGWNGLPQQVLGYNYNQLQHIPAVYNVNAPVASTNSDQQTLLAHIIMAALVQQSQGAPPSSNVAAITGTSNASSSQSQPQVPSTSSSIGQNQPQQGQINQQTQQASVPKNAKSKSASDRNQKQN